MSKKFYDLGAKVFFVSQQFNCCDFNSIEMLKKIRGEASYVLQQA
jgi:hypothetical protein